MINDPAQNQGRNHLDKVKEIALVGGTHGNELTGVHLVKQWNKDQLSARYPDLSIETLLANEAAISANKRYLNQDLNRCFKREDLNDESLDNREQLLAKKLNRHLGPKGSSRIDFIIDLHTSTANMKTNIVLIKLDAFHLKLAAFLKSSLPDVVITSETELMPDHHFLCSIADKGIVVEIGPVPQGCLQAEIFENTKNAVDKVLQFVAHYNQNALPVLSDNLEIMSYYSKLHFPVDSDGEQSAMVHPALVHKDFCLLRNGEPVFRDFNGKDIFYEGPETHIAFVNEAAYYDQKIAMSFCHPVVYSLKTFKPVTDGK